MRLFDICRDRVSGFSLVVFHAQNRYHRVGGGMRGLVGIGGAIELS